MPFVWHEQIRKSCFQIGQCMLAQRIGHGHDADEVIRERPQIGGKRAPVAADQERIGADCIGPTRVDRPAQKRPSRAGQVDWLPEMAKGPDLARIAVPRHRTACASPSIAR